MEFGDVRPVTDAKYPLSEGQGWATADIIDVRKVDSVSKGKARYRKFACEA